jgi:hypothetical protein
MFDKDHRIVFVKWASFLVLVPDLIELPSSFAMPVREASDGCTNVTVLRWEF